MSYDDASLPQEKSNNAINIDSPRFDQNTILGRARHFFQITNPLNLLASEQQLDDACKTIERFRAGAPDVTVEDVWRAKVLVDSAYHPDTGEKMNLIGRMSAQVPCNMLITGGMMTFYKTNAGVFFWQWINQSFNALVNFTNRSGDASYTNTQIGLSYFFATTGAVATAVSLNKALKKAPPVIGRMVPFVAVFAANMINIPLMRAQELRHGVPVFDENGNRLGYSTNAAQQGIAQVTVSRVFMAVPGMLFTPFIMNYFERKGLFRRTPWLALPIQIGLVGMCLSVSTPIGCALFKQYTNYPVEKLEPELRESIYQKKGKFAPTYVYFNKGL